MARPTVDWLHSAQHHHICPSSVMEIRRAKKVYERKKQTDGETRSCLPFCLLALREADWVSDRRPGPEGGRNDNWRNSCDFRQSLGGNKLLLLLKTVARRKRESSDSSFCALPDSITSPTSWANLIRLSCRHRPLSFTFRHLTFA